MGIIKRKIELYILLMVFWIVLNGYDNIQMIVYGAIIAFAIIWMTNAVLFDYDNALLHLPSLWRFGWFGGIVLIAIIKSSWLHVLRIIKNQSAYETFQVRLKTDNIIILTLIANAITMTPGTITIDMEKSVLTVVGFVQSEDDVSELIAEIVGYEKPFTYRRI